MCVCVCVCVSAVRQTSCFFAYKNTVLSRKQSCEEVWIVSTGTGNWGHSFSCLVRDERQKLVETDVHNNSGHAGKEKLSFQGRDINSILMLGHILVQTPHKTNTNVRMLADIPFTSSRRFRLPTNSLQRFHLPFVRV